MSGRYFLSGVTLFAAITLAHPGPAQALSSLAAQGGEVATSKDRLTSLPPATAGLLRDSTAAYQKMHTYQHTAEYVQKGLQGGNQILVFTLALERPNRFIYRADDADATAAASDGKTFINYKNDTTGKTYTRTAAPTTYKQIDIVNDVTFTPIGTYVIALMLQGDALADPDVRAFIQDAGEPKRVVEEALRYDTLTGKFGADRNTMTLFFDAQTHLLHKAVINANAEQNGAQVPVKITEIIENVKIDKPIPPAVFQYTPPKNAHWIVRNSGQPLRRLVRN